MDPEEEAFVKLDDYHAHLRDTFAAAALTGIVTVEAHFAPNAHRLVKDVAALAYDYADAMLEARLKQT